MSVTNVDFDLHLAARHDRRGIREDGAIRRLQGAVKEPFISQDIFVRICRYELKKVGFPRLEPERSLGKHGSHERNRVLSRLRP